MKGKVFQIPRATGRLQRLARRVAALPAGAEPLRSYTDRSGSGVIGAVRCKGCDAVIVRAGRPTRQYAEMTVEFDNGTKHVTPMCRRCAARRYTAAELERLYLVDMLELYDEEQFFGVENPFDFMLARSPVKSLRTLVLGSRSSK